MKKQEAPSKNDGKPTDANATAQATATAQAEAPEAAATDGLQEELDSARKEAATNLEGWQRTLAEFQNYRRRMERESKDTYQNATADVLKSLLPIIDDFERAMANLPDDIKQHSWISGLSLIHRKFLKLLEDFNVTPIDPVGETFDPNLHQAIGTDEDSSMESGKVSQTLQKGYVSGDRVLRPALVKVAK